MSDEHSPIEYEPDVVDAFGPDDDIVEVMRANSGMEARFVAAEIRAAGIAAAEYGDATAGMLGKIDHMEGARVMVRRDDLDRATEIAQEVVNREHEPVDPAEDAELTRLADESKGFSDPETGAQV
jgi:streptomycin 6-kinase